MVRYFFGSFRMVVTRFVLSGQQGIEVGVGDGIIRGELAQRAFAFVDARDQRIDLRQGIAAGRSRNFGSFNIMAQPALARVGLGQNVVCMDQRGVQVVVEGLIFQKPARCSPAAVQLVGDVLQRARHSIQAVVQRRHQSISFPIVPRPLFRFFSERQQRHQPRCWLCCRDRDC